MNRNALVAKVSKHFTEYFLAIETAALRGEVRRANGSPATLYYPNTLLISETPTHFVIELLGATKARSTVKTIERSMSSLASVLGKFPAPKTISLMQTEGRYTGGGFQSMALMSVRNQDIFERRYPQFPDLHPTVISYGGPLESDEAFHPFAFSDDLQDIGLVDVMLMANWQGRVRARYFQSALIIARSASSSELTRQLVSRFPVGQDTQLLAPATDRNHSMLVTAANFAALASIDKIGETTITRFLELCDFDAGLWLR